MIKRKMVKVTKSGNQYRITIPSEIIKLTKWVEGTEVIFNLHLKEPDSPLTEKTPLFVRKVGK